MEGNFEDRSVYFILFYYFMIYMMYSYIYIYLLDMILFGIDQFQFIDKNTARPSRPIRLTKICILSLNYC